MKFKFKNSTKNDFAVNLLLVLISALLIFIGAKIVSNKAAIVIFALSIAVSYCKIAVEAIEKIIGGKIHPSLISTLAVLIIFASQQFLPAAVVAAVYSLSKAVFNLICSLFSDKLLENEDAKPYYNVILDGEEKTIPADELAEGDVVQASKYEYLAFDYIFENEKGEKKSFKAGKFSACDKAKVTVVAQHPYEIDFENSEFETPSKQEKLTALITNVYTALAAVLAVVMFVISLTKGGAFTDSLYILGVYLLFANPLSINSGVLQAGLFFLKYLKSNGVILKNTAEIDKISGIKKVYFTDDSVYEGQNRASEAVVKAVKIAGVLEIETELLSGKDEQETKTASNVVGFKKYTSNCSKEQAKEIITKPVEKGVAAYVSSEEAEKTDKLVFVNQKLAFKDALPHFIKAVKSAKIYKWFTALRAALGALINALVIMIYASGIGDKLFSKLSTAVAEEAVDTSSLKEKLVKCFFYNDALAPWLIGFVHLFLVNLLLLVTIGFLNNNKKLR